MVTIYNVASGQSKTLDMVDAREHVASGRWAFTPAKPAPVIEPEPAPVDPVAAKIAALNAAMQKHKAKR